MAVLLKLSGGVFPAKKPIPAPPAGAGSGSSSPNGPVRAAGWPGVRVAYQGVRGAYSEFAARTACPGCAPVACRTFADAVAVVERGGAERAILPVESTLEGTAVRNYDLLLRRDLRVVQEINLFVHYCLLAMPGVQRGGLRRVISHPLALAHCGRAIARLGLDGEPVDDTAGAVEMLRSSNLLDTAAIASPRAALLYGLDVLAHGLQDEAWNVTRFLILSKTAAPTASPPAAVVKTSAVVAQLDGGSSMRVILKVLAAFSSRNINLTKLEVSSSPGPEPEPVVVLDVRVPPGKLRSFPHVLYVDFEGSVDEPRVKEAVDEIAGCSVFVRILGCYPVDSNIYDLH